MEFWRREHDWETTKWLKAAAPLDLPSAAETEQISLGLHRVNRLNQHRHDI